MKIVRKVFCEVPFEPSILVGLIFAGHGMGTFTKDGYIFHRCLITHVDYSSNSLSCRWLGMTPGYTFINNWKCTNSITVPKMINKKEDILTSFYLTNSCIVYVPSDIKAEDEILFHQTTNCYSPMFELR
jgi:hypothetical protein